MGETIYARQVMSTSCKSGGRKNNKYINNNWDKIQWVTK